MKVFYITLNNETDARSISHALLTRQIAVCTNWFPINCSYRWEDKIEIGKEVVLIVKTQAGYRQEIEEVISEHINYTNFIAELDVHSINLAFANWLQKEVPLKS